MRRGTTPKHVFNLPFDSKYIKRIKITYVQNEEVILTKTENDCVIQGNQIIVSLTQNDTFSFGKGIVEIQVRILTKSGDALASYISDVPVNRCLDEEVLE